jgi:hypothetical protein
LIDLVAVKDFLDISSDAMSMSSQEGGSNISRRILWGMTFERFRADLRTRQLVERNLEILSEASRRLPNEYKDREVQIPWRNRRDRQCPAA